MEEYSDRNKRPLISIRAKLMAAFVVGILIPVCAMLYLMSMRLPERYDRLAELRVRSALDGISSDFDSLMNDTRERVKSIANDDNVVEEVASISLKGSPYGASWFTKRIRTLKDATGLDMLKVINRKKTLIADAVNPEKFNVSYKNDPYVAEVLKNGVTRTFARTEKVGGKNSVVIMVYQPVWYQGAPVAVLIGGRKIGRDYLNRLHRLSSARVVLYVDYKPLIDSNSSETSAGLPIDKSFLEDLDRKPGLIRKVGSGDADFMVGGVPLTESQTGELLGFFVMGVSRDQVKNIMRQTRADIVLVALVGIGISLFLAVIISIGITRPISRLVQFARSIGRGDFSNKNISATSRDEIGLLAETMNRMAKDLSDYSEKLAYSERMAAWSDIARRMAHEIKNPLSPIQLSVENLRASFDEDRAAFDRLFPESAETVLEEVEKLRKLANEFSEFARLPAPVFEDVEAGELLRNLVAFHAGITPENVNIEYNIEETPLKVRADRDQLNRIFTNLIKNGIEAMGEGGTLHVSSYAENGYVKFIFRDEGKGIAEEDLEKIFMPYHTTKVRGTGLGLAIVKRIVQDHGAGMTVSSEPGRGATFELDFRQVD